MKKREIIKQVNNEEITGEEKNVSYSARDSFYDVIK